MTTQFRSMVGLDWSPSNMALQPAETMYHRVEKPKVEYPGSSYAVAQQRLSTLRGGADSIHEE